MPDRERAGRRRIVNRTSEPPRRLAELVEPRPSRSTQPLHRPVGPPRRVIRRREMATPSLATSYAAMPNAASNLGAVFSEHTEVTGIDTHNGKVTAVRTNHGLVRTDTVICTAGAWSQRIGEMAGVLLPIVPVRRQIGFTGPLMGAYAHGAVHPRSGQHLVLPQRRETVCCWGSRILARVLASSGSSLTSGRQPSQGRSRRRTVSRWREAGGGLAGLYENTPDHNALIGRTHTPRNFLYVTRDFRPRFSGRPPPWAS